MQITASMGSPTDGGNMVILNYNSSMDTMDTDFLKLKFD